METLYLVGIYFTGIDNECIKEIKVKSSRTLQGVEVDCLTKLYREVYALQNGYRNWKEYVSECEEEGFDYIEDEDLFDEIIANEESVNFIYDVTHKRFIYKLNN